MTRKELIKRCTFFTTSLTSRVFGVPVEGGNLGFPSMSSLASEQLSYSLPLEDCVMMCSATEERSRHPADLILSHLIQTQMNWTVDIIQFS